MDEVGWDPVMRILYLPAQHRLLGRKVCRVQRCVGTVHNDAPEICHRCFTRLTGLGMSVEDIAAVESLPAATVPAECCAIPQCRCRPTVRDAVMCEPHAQQFRSRRIPISLEQFERSASAAPVATAGMPGAGVHPHGRRCDRLLHHPLSAMVCRPTGSGRAGRTMVAGPGIGCGRTGHVNLRALPALVVVEVLITKDPYSRNRTPGLS